MLVGVQFPVKRQASNNSTFLLLILPSSWEQRRQCRLHRTVDNDDDGDEMVSLLLFALVCAFEKKTLWCE